MNQIVSPTLKIHIASTTLVHIPMTFRYLFDQSPELFCQIDFFIRHCLSSQDLLFCLSLIIVRYIYIFHAKNITAIQDDYWICFLNIWTLGFCVIAYIEAPRHFYSAEEVGSEESVTVV